MHLLEASRDQVGHRCSRGRSKLERMLSGASTVRRAAVKMTKLRQWRRAESTIRAASGLISPVNHLFKPLPASSLFGWSIAAWELWHKDCRPMS